MAIKEFRRPYDYTPGQTKEVIQGEQHTIPVSPPYDIYLIHIPRKETPSTVRIDGFTEVESEPGPGQFQVHYTEEVGNGPLGRITFNAADAGKTVAVDYHACGTAIWAEDRGDGRPNIAEMQEVLERVQEAGGIDYASAVSEFTPQNVKAALDALAGVRIVEMGSNSNGTYVRWENGLQVCWHQVSVGAFSGAQNETKSFTWTYPATFSDLARVLASSSYSGGDSSFISVFLIGLIDTSPTNSASVKGYMRDLVGGASITPRAALIAFGRWK